MNANQLLIGCALCATGGIGHANSYLPPDAHVTQIASSQLFVQNAVIFKVDKGTSDCPANSYIYYYGVNTDDLKELG